MKVVSEHERAVRYRNVRLELDEHERFEVAVPRYRQEPQRMLVTHLYLTWEVKDWLTDDEDFSMKWSITAANIRKDSSLGASKSITDWQIDQPDLVTQALADLKPEWFE